LKGFFSQKKNKIKREGKIAFGSRSNAGRKIFFKQQCNQKVSKRLVENIVHL
jgi:hypothetical protein